MDNLTEAKVMLFAVFGAIGAFFTHIGLKTESFTLLALLTILDYITGIQKARILQEDITSNRMKYGILSKIIILIIPVAFAISMKIINIKIDFLFFTIINLLVLSELYSIIGNIYSSKTKKELPEVEVISVIGNKIKDILKNTLEKDKK